MEHPLASFQGSLSVDFTAVFDHNFSTGLPWPRAQALNLGWGIWWNTLANFRNENYHFLAGKIKWIILTDGFRHLLNNVHAVHDLTKNNMSPVQPFSLHCKQQVSQIYWEKSKNLCKWKTGCRWYEVLHWPLRGYRAPRKCKLQQSAENNGPQIYHDEVVAFF